jgi:uncharacterized protein
MTSHRFMARRVAVALTLAFGLSAVHLHAAAQAASTPATASSPAKRDLAKRMLALQQPGFDALARNIVEGPARQLMASAEPVVRTQVPAEKREAVAKQLQDEARRYVDETTPTVRKRAQELAQSQVLPAIEEKYTEDELRQIVAFFESPAYKKLQQAQPQIDQALQQKLVADITPAVDTKARALQASMGKILGLPPAPAAGTGGGSSSNGTGGSGLKPPAPRPAGPAASKP